MDELPNSKYDDAGRPVKQKLLSTSNPIIAKISLIIYLGLGIYVGKHFFDLTSNIFISIITGSIIFAAGMGKSFFRNKINFEKPKPTSNPYGNENQDYDDEEFDDKRDIQMSDYDENKVDKIIEETNRENNYN